MYVFRMKLYEGKFHFIDYCFKNVRVFKKSDITYISLSSLSYDTLSWAFLKRIVQKIKNIYLFIYYPWNKYVN